VTAEELRAFEREVAEAFERKEVRGPVHLSGGNEDALIDVFRDIKRDDWVFSTYRSHFHALLHGIPRDRVMAEILAGRSMNLLFPEYRFFTSAIVGGCLPIAVGVAAGIKRHGLRSRAWCFVGDMAGTVGAFHEAQQFAEGHALPITFVVEDNGLSCDSPTDECWGADVMARDDPRNVSRYRYRRQFPHVGIGKWVAF
jgi:pyruvate dehydrogenase E1 component alpha subunit